MKKSSGSGVADSKEAVEKALPPQFQAKAKDGDGDGDGKPDKGEDKDGEDEEDEMDGGSDEEEEGSKKSELTDADLKKSIAKLEAHVQTSDAPTRKASLLAKAQKGELSKSDRDELFGLLGGAAETPKDTLAKSVTEGLQQNDTLQKALDVSDFLSEQHAELNKSLTKVCDAIDKSDARNHELSLLMAKAIVDTGKLVKAVSERLGVIEAQPARGPKSLGTGQSASGRVIEKSFGGQAPAGEELSKSQIMDGMETMVMKGGTRFRTGEDIATALSRYEQFNQISKGALDEVSGFLKSNTGAAH